MIRKAQNTDAAKIASIYRHYVENTSITFELTPPDEAEMLCRITKYTQKYPWLIMEVDGEIVGYAYGSKFREREAYRYTTEISVYISEEKRGRGYGRQLAVALLDELVRYGFYTAMAGITSTNENSIHLFQSLGFDVCGTYPNVGFKGGEWLSVVMMSKKLQPAYNVPIQELIERNPN